MINARVIHHDSDGKSFAPKMPDRTPGPYAGIFELQRTAGNQAVTWMLQRHSGTVAAAVRPLPARPRREWVRALTAGDYVPALNSLWTTLIARGDVDGAVAPLAAADDGPGVTFRVGGSGSIIGTTRTRCATPATDPPAFRVNVPKRFVAPADAAERERSLAQMHASMRHEHRHMQQYKEQCTTGQQESGDCHYCNDPNEMDAYLAELESGLDLVRTDRAHAADHRAALRNGWGNLFVNWEYLSPEQQEVFASRKQAVEARINRLFPNYPWASDGNVRAYRRTICDPFGPVERQRGQCSAPVAPSRSVRQPQRPPPTVGERRITEIVQTFDRQAASFRGGARITSARFMPQLDEWFALAGEAGRTVEREHAHTTFMGELRRSYSAAVNALLDAGVAQLRHDRAAVLRTHQARINPVLGTEIRR